MAVMAVRPACSVMAVVVVVGFQVFRVGRAVVAEPVDCSLGMAVMAAPGD